MTWMNPDAYEETFRCECCGEDFVEDMLVQVRPDYWTCRTCFLTYEKEEC